MQEVQVSDFQMMQKQTETAGYLDSHSKSLCNVGAINFDYTISDRPFSEAGKFEKLSYPVLAKFSSLFFFFS